MISEGEGVQSFREKKLFDKVKDFVDGFNVSNVVAGDKYFTRKQLCCLLSITLIILFYVLTSSIFTQHSYTDFVVNPFVKSSSDSCKWTFYDYSPSSWEAYWYNNISTLQNNACPTLAQKDQFNKSVTTLQYIISSQKTAARQPFSSEEYDALLSKMYYRYACSDSSEPELLVSQYIEPLIGILRDPLTMCPSLEIPPELVVDNTNSVLSKRFILLGPSAAYQDFGKPVTSIVPWLSPRGSQTILFDLGSSYFGGSIQWFYEYFNSNSLHLDRIIAFEFTQYVPHTYWTQVPDDVIGLITFINTGVEKTGKFNPWNILKSIAKPEDYVLIKLDIDTFGLENDLANEIVNDTSISSLIDEMFFEMHVSIGAMSGYWGWPPGDLKDSYILFTKLRKLGIRMHSWP